MTNYREILRMKSLGISNKSIASSLHCSRNTVAAVLSRANELTVNWSNSSSLSNEELKLKLYPESVHKLEYQMPDYDKVYRELQRPGVTLSLLWVEYCEECRQSGKLPYKSTQFNKYYSEYVNKTKATMHINHHPGEKMEVDWAGDTAEIIDPITGKVVSAYIFVAVLPYSQYAYVEAFPNEQMESWIKGHVNAYQYFGGATRMLVPDNLKTGITRNGKDETIVNKTYQSLAEYYGTAIVPARVRTPKDKPSAEGSVRHTGTWVIASLRNQKFFSFDELNTAILERLYDFNHRPFQKREDNRAIAFDEEKAFLIPLPKEPFELDEWKKAIVQLNYHISVDKQNYSVPYEYIHKTVDVRLTSHTVEIFYNGTRIASHLRLHGRRNQYSTQESHMPEDHQKYLEWNGERFIKWAEKIGPNTVVVIKSFLSAHKIEEQGYKSCLTLLKLTDKYPIERIENACARILSFTHTPSYKSIRTVLKTGQDKLLLDNTPADGEKPQRQGFTRGADYYRRDK